MLQTCQCIIDPIPLSANNRNEYDAPGALPRTIPATGDDLAIGVPPSMCKPCQMALKEAVLPVVQAAIHPPSPEVANAFADVIDLKALREDLIARVNSTEWCTPGWSSWDCEDCWAGKRKVSYTLIVSPMRRVVVVTTYRQTDDSATVFDRAAGSSCDG